jgi:hypothetical protein
MNLTPVQLRPCPASPSTLPQPPPPAQQACPGGLTARGSGVREERADCGPAVTGRVRPARRVVWPSPARRAAGRGAEGAGTSGVRQCGQVGRGGRGGTPRIIPSESARTCVLSGPDVCGKWGVCVWTKRVARPAAGCAIGCGWWAASGGSARGRPARARRGPARPGRRRRRGPCGGAGPAAGNRLARAGRCARNAPDRRSSTGRRAASRARPRMYTPRCTGGRGRRRGPPPASRPAAAASQNPALPAWARPVEAAPSATRPPGLRGRRRPVTRTCAD